MSFNLNDAETIDFRKIRSAGGNHIMGKLVIHGVFGLVAEKITLKFELEEYNKLFEASQLWP